MASMKKAGSGFAKGTEIFDFCLHSASFGFAKGASITEEFVMAVLINKRLISVNIKKFKLYGFRRTWRYHGSCKQVSHCRWRSSRIIT